MLPLRRPESVSERALRDFARAKELRDASELGVVESGPDTAGPAQVAIVVVADEQSAEVLARLTRLRPSADDELLLLEELFLSPRGCSAAALIDRLSVLRDEPFPSFTVGPIEQRPPVVDDDLAQAKQVFGRGWDAHAILEAEAARGQRQRPDVLVTVTQQIEQDEHRRLILLAPFDLGKGRAMDPALNVLEAQRTA